MHDPIALRAFANLVDTSEDFVGVADPDGRMLYVNPYGRRMIGTPPKADISHFHIHDIFPEWSVGAFIREGTVDQLSNVSMNRDARLQTVDGRRIPTSLSVVAHLSGEYHVDHFCLFARDVTEQRRLGKAWETIEKRLEELFRMRVICKVASGLADNLDSTLGRIGRNIGEALDGCPNGEEPRSQLNRAMARLNTARDTLRRLASVALPETVPKEPVSVSEAVKEAILIARSFVPATIVVRENVPPECGTVSTDPIQIQQIVLTLLVNARDSVQPTGGAIEVRLETVDFGKRNGERAGRRKASQYARVTVEDNGAGLETDVLASAFEPDLRKSATLNERVLSLWVVNKIVDECGGSVTIHNKSGRGTSYHVYLPLSGEGAPTPSP
jgi:PAS domain S-box-containing protein